MAATAALSAAAVGRPRGGRLRRLRRAHGRAGARRRHRSRSSPACCGSASSPASSRSRCSRASSSGSRSRSWSASSRSSSASRRASGDFFEQLWDLLGDLGDTQRLDAARRRSRRSRSCSGSGARTRRARLARRRAVGIVARRAVRPRRHGVAIVGQIDSGLPSSGCRTSALHELPRPGRGGGRHRCWSASPRGSARPRRTPPRDHYEIDANRELIGLGAANLGAGLSSGMVVDGSLSKTAVNGAAGAQLQLSGLVVAGLTIVTLLFLTGLFEDLPEATLAAVVIAAVIELVDVAALRRALPLPHRGARAHLRRGGPPGLRRRGGRARRRARLRHAARAVHRHRASRWCCCSTAHRGRTSPSSGRVPGTTASSDDARRATRRTEPDPGDRRAARRERRCSSPTPTPCATGSGHTSSRRHEGDRARCRDRCPTIDLTAVNMLAGLARGAPPRRGRARPRPRRGRGAELVRVGATEADDSGTRPDGERRRRGGRRRRPANGPRAARRPPWLRSPPRARPLRG